MTKSTSGARASAVLFAVLCSLSLNPSMSEARNDSYPMGPRAEMTSGSLCDHPDRYRYPENIAYCERDVDTELKREIIRDYDARFGYRIGSMDRQQFKIDHYIPLCMGGSNNKNNLWPQHKSVFEQTDLLEQRLCEEMAQGHLKQREAVDMIRAVKNDLSKVDEVFERIGGR